MPPCISGVLLNRTLTNGRLVSATNRAGCVPQRLSTAIFGDRGSLMIKLNRIGYKLGLAGAIGVLLSAGLVANQIMSEAEITAANQRTARSQGVIDGVSAAMLDLRMIQLAERTIRLAKTAEEVDKNIADMQRFKATQKKALDETLASAQRPDTKERLQKIQSLMDSYTSGVEDLAKAQKSSLLEIEKRDT